ncbi:MAG TPA: hypothetical protein VK558_13985 [Patescibacteria group bacterium]|nr:hypothetical protein [Patescibacteria group bacterium]
MTTPQTDNGSSADRVDAVNVNNPEEAKNAIRDLRDEVDLQEAEGDAVSKEFHEALAADDAEE